METMAMTGKRHRFFGVIALLGSISWLVVSLYGLCYCVLFLLSTFIPGISSSFTGIISTLYGFLSNLEEEQWIPFDVQSFVEAAVFIPCIVMIVKSSQLLRSSNGVEQAHRFTSFGASLAFFGFLAYVVRDLAYAYFTSDGSSDISAVLLTELQEGLARNWVVYALAGLFLFLLISLAFAKKKVAWKVLLLLGWGLGVGLLVDIVLQYGLMNLTVLACIHFAVLILYLLLGLIEIIREPYNDMEPDDAFAEVPNAPLNDSLPYSPLSAALSMEGRLKSKLKALDAPYDELTRYVYEEIDEMGKAAFREKVYSMLERHQINQGEYILVLHIIDRKKDK
jgi:hypothetical protein